MKKRAQGDMEVRGDTRATLGWAIREDSCGKGLFELSHEL